MNNITYKSNGENIKDIGGASQCIHDHLFGEDCGDHSTSDCTDIIYITGEQTNSEPPICDKARSLKHSLPLHDAICNKTQVFAIGIGRRLNTTELRCIADSPVNGQDRVFQFKSFEDFQKAVGKSVQYVYEKKIYCQIEEDTNIECDEDRLDITCNH